MRTSYWLKWFCTTLFHCGHLLFTWKTHCGLKFHFGQIHRSEVCTEVSFTSSEPMWEVKFQTGLSSLWVSCKRALNDFIFSTIHSSFSQKIITYILDIVFIRRSHIAFSEIHLKFVTEFLVLIFLLVDGRLVGGRCTWLVVGWSVVGGSWSVGRLVGSWR